MNVRLPKSWDRLPQSEKEAIARVKEDEINAHFAKLQKNWLMLSCMVMARYMGMSKEDCLLYLANFREVYRLNSQKKTDAEQKAWLEEQMNGIFGVDGFPTKYLDKLEEM